MAAVCVEHGPLPTALVSAKRVYLQNAGGDMGVFDHLYEKVKHWGRWQVVANREDADLILLTTDTNQVVGAIASASGGPYSATATAVPIMSMPRFLIVVDAHTNEELLRVSCERRLSAGYTANVLVNRVRKRIEGK
jgi:hypothetical protein